MFNKALFFCLIGFIFPLNSTQFENPLQRRVCYFANWAPYRELEPALYPDKIDPTLCTHIHYAFAKIDPNSLNLVPTEEHDMNWTERSNMPLFIRLYSLKRRNPALKILLAVGGWSAKSTGFNMATRSAHNRTRFINNTIKLLREWNFDGIDLDWEFPGEEERGADKNSKQNFNYLVNDFRIAVNEEAELIGKRKLLVTSAVAADPTKINNGYVVKNLCEQLDYISVMTYDYHGTWDNVTGLNSPLYGRNTDHFDQSDNNWKNANYSINYWIANGCPPNKINFGLAAYGRSFTLRNITMNRVGSPILKGGLAGAYTKEEGIYSYFEICDKLKTENWKKFWDDKQQSVYATHGNQWVGFDNQRSIALKVKWAYSMFLGGTMLWTLDFDDYTGEFCEEGSFPIANAIRAVFEEFNNIGNSTDGILETITTSASLTTTTMMTTTTSLKTTTSIMSSTNSSFKKTFPFIINNDDNKLSLSYNSLSDIDSDSITIIFKNNTNLTMSKVENYASQDTKNSAFRIKFCFMLNYINFIISISYFSRSK